MKFDSSKQAVALRTAALRYSNTKDISRRPWAELAKAALVYAKLVTSSTSSTRTRR